MIRIQKNLNGWFGYHTIGNGTLKSQTLRCKSFTNASPRIKNRPWETEKNGLRYLTSGGKHRGGSTHGGRNQDGPGVSICKGVSHPGSGDHRVCDGVCTHLLPHAHFSATVCRRVILIHFSRVCAHTHGSRM